MPHPEIPLRSVGVGVLILPVPASSVPHNEHGIVTGMGTKGGHNLGKINRELGILLTSNSSHVIREKRIWFEM